MTQAMSDPTVRVRHFTHPLLSSRLQKGKHALQTKTGTTAQKGRANQKGKLRSNPNEGKGKGSAKADVKLLKTPDTRPSARGTIAPEDAHCLSAKQCTGCNGCLGGHPCFDKVCPNWVQRGGFDSKT